MEIKIGSKKRRRKETQSHIDIVGSGLKSRNSDQPQLVQ